MFKQLLDEAMDNSNVQRLRDLVVLYNDMDSGVLTEDVDNLPSGLRVIFEMAEYLTDEQIDLFCESLDGEHNYHITEETLEEYAEYLEEDELEEDFDPKSRAEIEEDLDDYMGELELNEIKRFKLVRKKAPEKLRLKKRAVAKKKLGKRADTELFKRKFQFDKKKKRFIRRSKQISRGAFKKSNKMWRKLMKRRSHK